MPLHWKKYIYVGSLQRPPHREILKTAIGASQTVDWEHHKDSSRLIDRLKIEAYQIIAVEQAEGSVELQSFEVEPGHKYALVFGNEVSGVSEEVMQQVDKCIEVPTVWHQTLSEYLRMCGGWLVWELFRKMELS